MHMKKLEAATRTAFTLTEMLIVIAILVSLLQPALKKAYEKTLLLSCINVEKNWVWPDIVR